MDSTVADAAATASNAVNWNGVVMMWGTIIIFNLAILQLLRVTLGQADFREAMSEKATTPTLVAGQQPAPVPAPGGAAPVANAVPVAVPQPAALETSYSRVAGMIGAVVLACFVWAVGNVILYKMFADTPQNVSALLASLGTYFLAAASLFAPYAVNQLSNAFKN